METSEERLLPPGDVASGTSFAEEGCPLWRGCCLRVGFLRRLREAGRVDVGKAGNWNQLLWPEQQKHGEKQVCSPFSHYPVSLMCS